MLRGFIDTSVGYIPTNDHNRKSVCNTSSANTEILFKDPMRAYFCCSFNLMPLAPNLSKEPLTDDTVLLVNEPLDVMRGTGSNSHSIANMYC